MPLPTAAEFSLLLPCASSRIISSCTHSAATYDCNHLSGQLWRCPETALCDSCIRTAFILAQTPSSSNRFVWVTAHQFETTRLNSCASRVMIQFTGSPTSAVLQAFLHAYSQRHLLWHDRNSTWQGVPVQRSAGLAAAPGSGLCSHRPKRRQGQAALLQHPRGTQRSCRSAGPPGRPPRLAAAASCHGRSPACRGVMWRQGSRTCVSCAGAAHGRLTLCTVTGSAPG